jgi:type II secretory pathway component PulM
MTLAAELDSRDRLTHWWRLRTRAERVGVVAAAALAAAALGWLLLWLPLQGDIARLTRSLALQRVALADARAQAQAMAGLERREAAPARDPRAGLDLALGQLGIKASAIERSGDDLRVTVDGISFDALTALLESLQREAALRAVDLTAVARVEPGMVRAEFTLRR